MQSGSGYRQKLHSKTARCRHRATFLVYLKTDVKYIKKYLH